MKTNLHKKITYKGWIETVIIASGWNKDKRNKLMQLCHRDIKGMAKTWLGGWNRPYIKTFIMFQQRYNLKLIN